MTDELNFMIEYAGGDCDFAPTLERAKELADASVYGGCVVWDMWDSEDGLTEDHAVYYAPVKIPYEF